VEKRVLFYSLPYRPVFCLPQQIHRRDRLYPVENTRHGHTTISFFFSLPAVNVIVYAGWPNDIFYTIFGQVCLQGYVCRVVTERRRLSLEANKNRRKLFASNIFIIKVESPLP